MILKIFFDSYLGSSIFIPTSLNNINHSANGNTKNIIVSYYII